jgi:hypothetical protein
LRLPNLTLAGHGWYLPDSLYDGSSYDGADGTDSAGSF